MLYIDPRQDRSNGPAQIEAHPIAAEKAATPALPNGVAKELDLGAMFKGWEYRLPEVAEKFWQRVDVYGPNECWPWNGRVGAGEYGEAIFRFRGKRRVFRAHRFAFVLAYPWTVIPAGVQVRHRCDERLCCNPAHLHLTDPHGHPLTANGNGHTSFEALLP